MPDYDLNGIKLKDLDYEVIKRLQTYFHKPIDLNDLQYDKSKKEIIYKNHVFHYYFRDGIVLTVYKNGLWKILTPKNINRNVKTKKGKVKNAKAIVFSLSLLVAAMGANYIKDVVLDEDVTVETSYDEKNEYPREIYIPQIEEEIDKTLEEIEEEVNNVTFIIPLVKTEDYQAAKREETNEYLGNYIESYAPLYGLDASFVSALISHERSDDVYKSNPAQLTSSLCGGLGFKAPMFNEGEYIGDAKIYVLGSFYDDYPLDDIETMSNFPKFSLSEKEQVKMAINLKNKGYEIYRLKDIKNNFDTNIKVATIYLSYLVNQEDNLFRGALAYNYGLSVVKNISDDRLYEEIQNVDDNKYLQHIYRYFTEEDYQNGFTVNLINKGKVHYDLQVKELNEKDTNIIRR